MKNVWVVKLILCKGNSFCQENETYKSFSWAVPGFIYARRLSGHDSVIPSAESGPPFHAPPRQLLRSCSNISLTVFWLFSNGSLIRNQSGVRVALEQLWTSFSLALEHVRPHPSGGIFPVGAAKLPPVPWADCCLCAFGYTCMYFLPKKTFPSRLLVEKKWKKTFYVVNKCHIILSCVRFNVSLHKRPEFEQWPYHNLK